MRIKEILLDAFINTRLFEMARERNEALKVLTNLQDQTSLHLVKILMYSDQPTVNHWESELTNWLKICQRIKLKPKNKHLDYETYKLYLWEHLLETVAEVQDHMNEIFNDYNIPPSQPDAGIVHKQAESIMDSICKDLSLNQFSDIRSYVNVV